MNVSFDNSLLQYSIFITIFLRSSHTFISICDGNIPRKQGRHNQGHIQHLIVIFIMATTSDRADRNGNTNISNDYKKRKEEDEDGNKLQSSSVDGVQGKKTTRKVNGSLQIGKTDTLSSMQSINENKKSDQTSPTSNKSSDINKNKKNDEQTIEATQQKEELGSTSLSSTSIKNNNIKQEETIIASSSLKTNEDSRNDKSISAISDTKINGSPSKFITSRSKNDNDNDTFSIEQDDAQHLTDFQLEKARYFFNVNLGRLFTHNIMKIFIEIFV